MALHLSAVDRGVNFSEVDLGLSARLVGLWDRHLTRRAVCRCLRGAVNTATSQVSTMLDHQRDLCQVRDGGGLVLLSQDAHAVPQPTPG